MGTIPRWRAATAAQLPTRRYLLTSRGRCALYGQRLFPLEENAVEDVLIPIVIIPTVFGSFIWAIYLVVSAIRSRQQMRLSSEFHTKLLERIGSARELGELLNTDGGRG